MAFSKNAMARVSSSQTNSRLFSVWAYTGTQTGVEDDLATIRTDGYFDDVVGDLSLGDRIHVDGTDGTDILSITQLTPTVNVVTIIGSNKIKDAFNYTSTGGGTLEFVNRNGIMPNDVLAVTIDNNGTNNVTIVQASAATNGIDLTLDADPGNDAEFDIIVVNP